MARKKNTTPAERLARMLRDAHIEAIIECDPHGVTGELKALNGLGRHRGYCRVAERLLKRGVKLPSEEG